VIDKKLEAAGGKDWSCLNDAERTTVAGYFFALDVTNGGMEKFFLERGDRWRETLQAIKTVGATRLAALYEEALTVFPHGEPASDYETRYNQLLAAGALGGKGLLWELTGQYYDLQAASAENCLHQRMTAFAIKQLTALSEHEPA
jgi:hypothetical protein